MYSRKSNNLTYDFNIDPHLLERAHESDARIDRTMNASNPDRVLALARGSDDLDLHRRRGKSYSCGHLLGETLS